MILETDMIWFIIVKYSIVIINSLIKEFAEGMDFKKSKKWMICRILRSDKSKVGGQLDRQNLEKFEHLIV